MILIHPPDYLQSMGDFMSSFILDVAYVMMVMMMMMMRLMMSMMMIMMILIMKMNFSDSANSNNR